MTKFVKMSLAAAVAVAGLSSTASAGSLEEAIKGVEVSGMMRYRYEHKESDKAGDDSTTQNVYDLDVAVVVPVNDMLTATVGTVTDATTKKADANVNPELEEAYFTLTTKAVTAMAGKQAVPGPFSDGAVGSGLVALVPAGPITIAAGHFENHSVTLSEADLGVDLDADGKTTGKVAPSDVTVVNAGNGQANAYALIGSFGDINADLWYFAANNLWSATSLHVSAPVGPVSIDFRHTDAETESRVQNALTSNSGKTDASLTKLVVSGKFGMANTKFGYAMTGDDNGLGANRVSVDADADSATDFQYWNLNVGKLADASALLVDVMVDVAPKITAGIGHIMVDYGTTYQGNQNAEAAETKLEVNYKMSKNFNLKARYAMWDVKKGGDNSTTTDYTRSRIEAKYSF